MFTFNPKLRTLYANRLSRHQTRKIHDRHLIPAAVAIVLSKSKTGDEVTFLLTQRAPHLTRHGGQYALPGGRIEANESIQRAALRELYEEVGIIAPPNQIIGQLDDFPTRSGFCVSPVVVWLDDDPKITLDPTEVNAIFAIPLKELHHPDVPRLEAIPESNQPVLSIFLDSLRTRVFAPTAAILYQFREVAMLGKSTRVAHYEQPVFAWR